MNTLLVHSALVPFAVSAVAAGLLRLIGGAERGAMIAAAGISLAFLVGYVLILGLPAAWPTSAAQKILVIAVLATLVGLALDLSKDTPEVTRLLAYLLPLAALLWLGWTRVTAPDWADIAALAVTAIAGGFAIARTLAQDAEATESGIKLMVAAAALGFIAVLGRSASFGQLSGILAAATAGFLAWNWPIPRFRFAAAAVLGCGVIFLALTGAVAVFTNAPKPALGLLFPIFFADMAVGRIRIGTRRLDDAVRPVLVFVVALIPAIAAVGLAHLLGGSGY